MDYSKEEFMMFRFKVEIIIDEEKVVKDQLYKPKTLYKYIKDVFNYYHLKEVKGNNLNHIVFVDRGNNRDYGGLWSGIWQLYDQAWFKKYALKCLWFDKKENEPEDVLKEAADFEKRMRS